MPIVAYLSLSVDAPLSADGSVIYLFSPQVFPWDSDILLLLCVCTTFIIDIAIIVISIITIMVIIVIIITITILIIIIHHTSNSSIIINPVVV